MLKTIKIEESIHKKLGKLGGKGDTFSDIINRLLKDAKDKGKS